MKTCIVCDKTFEPAANDEYFENVPYGGTVFTSGGHYGSTVWDPMGPYELTIVVCDDCLRERKGRAEVLTFPDRPRPQPVREPWDPDADKWH